MLLRKGKLACQPGPVATVTSEASVQVPHHWYPNTAEKLLMEVFLPIKMAKSCLLFLSNRCRLGFFLVSWLGFFCLGFCCCFFNIYGLNEQTGVLKYSLAKNPVKFCAFLWITIFHRHFFKTSFHSFLIKAGCGIQ